VQNLAIYGSGELAIDRRSDDHRSTDRSRDLTLEHHLLDRQIITSPDQQMLPADHLA
jgi:hypothetical protein